MVRRNDAKGCLRDTVAPPVRDPVCSGNQFRFVSLCDRASRIDLISGSAATLTLVVRLSECTWQTATELRCLPWQFGRGSWWRRWVKLTRYWRRGHVSIESRSDFSTSDTQIRSSGTAIVDLMMIILCRRQDLCPVLCEGIGESSLSFITRLEVVCIIRLGERYELQ